MCQTVWLAMLNPEQKQLTKATATASNLTMDTLALNRRTLVAVTALTAASVVVPPLWAQPRLEKARVSIAVAGRASFHYLPLTIADQLGYFKAEGLEVEINDFAGGSNALDSAAAGMADVISGAYEHTISLRSRGQQFLAFVLQGRAPAISMGISPKALPHYRTVIDLKGKKIGVSVLGSSTHLVARHVLSRAGLKAEDVIFVELGMTDGALTAFRTGQVDAMSNDEPTMTLLEQKGEIRIIADTRTLKGTVDVFGGPMPAGCLYAPMEFIRKNPNTVQAMTDAMTHSLKWLQTAGPGDLIKTVPEAFLRGDRAMYLAAFNKMRESISPDGMFSDEGARTAVRVLASFDSTIKVDKIELSKTYTNDFARKAKERFKA